MLLAYLHTVLGFYEAWMYKATG